MMLELERIKEIRVAQFQPNGYEIVFDDERFIWLRKRRTIVGLLLLIKYSVCSEADLAGSNNRLKEIKHILSGKYVGDWIKDRYGDANKPFSELWTEEGFPFIRAEGLKGNKQYVLDPEDHELLFQKSAKSERRQLNNNEKELVLKLQKGRCNICGSFLKEGTKVKNGTFAKDRVRIEYDHRIPIEKGGSNDIGNFQALCHYCNKCKRQICFMCKLDICNPTCALVEPEKFDVVIPTSEDISDRIVRLL